LPPSHPTWAAFLWQGLSSPKMKMTEHHKRKKKEGSRKKPADLGFALFQQLMILFFFFSIF
jgi:hypothetical protein